MYEKNEKKEELGFLNTCYMLILIIDIRIIRLFEKLVNSCWWMHEDYINSN